MRFDRPRQLVWLLLALVWLTRILTVPLLKIFQPIEIGAFPVNGRLFIHPLLVDLALPLLLLILLRQRLPRPRPMPWRTAGAAVAEGVLLLVAVVMPAAWLLQGQLNVGLSITLASLARLAQFLLDFLLFNVLLDLLAAQPRWERYLYAFLASLALIYAEDLLVAGLCLWAATLYLRAVWRSDHGRALLTAFALGAGILLLQLTGYQHYYQMVWGMLPLIAVLVLPAPFIMLAFAWLWRARPRWTLLQRAASVVVFVLAVGVLRLPVIPAPPAFAHVEQIGLVRLEYNDQRTAEFGREYARFIDAALNVTQKHYGFTPRASGRVALVEVGDGGLYHLSPGPVYETYGRVAAGALAPEVPPPLNVYVAPPHAPFGILHEYCHTFGGPSYPLWGEPFNEGWGSYCATRLMKLVYQDYGPGLLRVPYDYSAYADTLTAYPLANDRGVYHSHEYTGFRLWTAAGERLGERELFGRYMAAMSHEFSVITLDPSAAGRIANAIAPDLFAQYGFTYGASRGWLDYVCSAILLLAGLAVVLVGRHSRRTRPPANVFLPTDA